MSRERFAKVKDHWENQKTISLRDTFLKDLEIEKILNFVEKQENKKRVLEIGCGDGEGTVKYRRGVDCYVAVDYSQAMLKKAVEREGAEDVLFVRCDARYLPFKPSVLFDMIISERCLINLPSKEEQYKAIEKLCSRLSKNGGFVFMEGSADGLKEVNRLREKVGLTPISMPWHNLFFDEKEVTDILKRETVVLEKGSFALYYLNSRVLNAAVSFPEPPGYDSDINRFSYMVSQALDEKGFELFKKTIGQIFYLYLEKK